MSRVITVTNQRGGAGKTTTATSLTAGLHLKGYKTLLVDIDAQCNSTYAMAAKAGGASALGVLTGEVKAEDAIQHTPSGDIIAASKSLTGADAFLTDTGKEYRLKEALESLQRLYDFILIDTPPALGILTINALTASNSVIIPAQAEIFSLQGVEQLGETIEPVRKYCNPALRIEGILLTRYNTRSVLNKEVAQLAERIAAKLGTKLFKTYIRENVAVREAQLIRQTIFEYAPRAKATEDYLSFIAELLGEKE